VDQLWSIAPVAYALIFLWSASASIRVQVRSFDGWRDRASWCLRRAMGCSSSWQRRRCARC
jgi:hypothetical protein